MPEFEIACPISISQYPHVTLAHGGGGRLMHQLIDQMIRPAFSNPLLEEQGDGAVFHLDPARVAMTTDSYVVKPLFFPGGDIGSMSVFGTVNDLAMCGAKPYYLSVGLILEEGFSMETLWQIIQSMRKAAQRCDVQLVTGDTKVVDKGKGDGIYINTTGVGILEHQQVIGSGSVKEGDQILISGDLGRHGVAIMAERDGLKFESRIESDSAPLAGIVLKLIEEGIRIHCLRDLTRGGLASALNEIIAGRSLTFQITEGRVPVREDVRGACEILGLDPLYVANEGRFALFVPAADADRALVIMRAFPQSVQAQRIGEVTDEPASNGKVLLESLLGVRRILDMLSGEQLPRIC